MPVRKEELTRAMEVINEAVSEINTQDNRITSDPIFMVQVKHTVYGIDADGCDDCEGWDWYDLINGESYEKGTDEYEEAQEYLDENDDDPEGWYRCGYITYWHNFQPFFTEKAAQRYIDSNRHNLTEPRIYVESGYRNYEWQAIRTVLKNIADIAGEESWSKVKS